MSSDIVSATLRCNEFQIRLSFSAGASRNVRAGIEDWIRSTLDFESHDFRGSALVLFDGDELARFLPEIKEVYERLEGIARLVTVEPALDFSFEFTPRGLVVVRGKLQQSLGKSVSVHFQGTCDQSDVGRLIHDLAQAGF